MSYPQGDAFLNLLIAAMLDAAVEKKLTQLKTVLSPDGKGQKIIRIVVIPGALVVKVAEVSNVNGFSHFELQTCHFLRRLKRWITPGRLTLRPGLLETADEPAVQ